MTEGDALGGEAAVGLVAEMQDHQGGAVLDGRLRWAARGLDMNRIGRLVELEYERTADELEVANELSGTVCDGFRCRHQIVDQGIGTERGDARELESKIWREALLLSETD